MGSHEQRNARETKRPGSMGCTGVQMDGTAPTVSVTLKLVDWNHAAAAGRNNDHVVAVVDVRHAHFYAKPLPKTFVELPAED